MGRKSASPAAAPCAGRVAAPSASTEAVPASGLLGAPFWIAVAGTGLWALNVRLSEAVIWPAARGHQFAAVCSLAALVLLLGCGRHRRWLALGVLACGLFAKETTLFAMAAIPFFLPAWRKERAFLTGFQLQL